MTSAEEWARRFSDVPPVLASLLRDLLHEKSARLQQQRDRLRRPVTPGFETAARDPAALGAPRDGMAQIEALVYPQYSEKPFGAALDDATTLPRGAVAFYAGLSRGQLFDMERGNKPFTMVKLEAIARAVGVEPAYFHEWRLLAVRKALEEALTPERSAWAYAQMVRPAVPTPGTRGRVRSA